MAHFNKRLKNNNICEKVRDFYDENYHQSGHRKLLSNDGFYWFLSYIADKKYWKFLEGCSCVLEVGCGVGQNIYGHQDAMGIDISYYAVNMCRKRGINAEVMLAEKMNFKKNEFDGIICSHIIEHLENPFDVLKKIHWLLKPNGKLVVAIPLPYAKSSDQDQHLYCWNIREITNLLERSGFNVVYHKSFAVRFKSVTYRLPFSVAYLLSRFIGYILRPIRFRSGVNELVIYATRLDR